MEFKFRAVDERPLDYLSLPLSTTNSYTERALLAGLSVGGANSELMGDSNKDVVQRELEKERIREEIIVAEMVRRRMLEAEVRTELMIEREIAKRRTLGAEGFSHLNPSLPMAHSFIGRTAVDMSPLPRLPEIMAHEVKPKMEAKKDRLIVLDKPNPDHFGAKRKPETPLIELKKKPKEEWSCALCQVSATSERGLSFHFQGKKHKAKEEALRAGKTTITNNASLPQQQISGKPPLRLMESTALNGENEELPMEKYVQEVEKTCEGVAEQRTGRMEESKAKRKFDFWCEECEIGTHTKIVLEAHKRGKKHKARLERLGRSGDVVHVTQTSEAVKKDQ